MKPPLAMANELLNVFMCSGAHVFMCLPSTFVRKCRVWLSLFEKVFREFEGLDFLDSASGNAPDVSI